MLKEILKTSVQNKIIQKKERNFWLDMEKSMSKEQVNRLIDILKSDLDKKEVNFKLQNLYNKHLTHWEEGKGECFD